MTVREKCKNNLNCFYAHLLPTHPTPIISLARGDRPWKMGNNLPLLFNVDCDGLPFTLAMVGAAEIPPNKKLPPTLIPAVCHPANFPNRWGSFAMNSVAIRPA